ncbi:MAG TPA: hypothetical protein VMU35_05015 [Methylomirabilota bacterium]|nr:hypothetical protein [Methylomirabilota bacterium]
MKLSLWILQEDVVRDRKRALANQVEALWNANFRNPKDMADVIRSRSKETLKPGANEVALAIDFLTKAGRIKNEPPNQVPTQPTTPETPPITPPTTPETQPSTQIPSAPTSASTPVSTSTASTGPSDVPGAIEVLDYVIPILSAHTTMTTLRKKIGYEKGKEWTSVLNSIVNQIIPLVNRRTPHKAIYDTMRTLYGYSMGQLVVSISTLPRHSDGTLVEGWEDADLCSNLKAKKKPMSPPDSETDSEADKNRSEGDKKEGTSEGTPDSKQIVAEGTSDSKQIVADDAPITSRSPLNWLPLNPNDPDDIAIYIELVVVC